jgi:hypothetical protein
MSTGQDARVPIGLEPQRIYRFEDACTVLGLSGTVRKHLLRTLQLQGRDDEFKELTEKQKFVVGSAVWAGLGVIKAEVRAEAQARNKLENKRRRGDKA